LADKLTNKEIKQYEHFQKEHTFNSKGYVHRKKRGTERETQEKIWGQKGKKCVMLRTEYGKKFKKKSWKKTDTDGDICLPDSSHISSSSIHTCNKNLSTSISPVRLKLLVNVTSYQQPVHYSGIKHFCKLTWK
jgi:hypothetical protein